MTPYERLMAEALPTGTFGHAQPTSAQPRTRRPWTEEEQAQHRAELEAALNGHALDERSRTRQQKAIAAAADDARRHLTAVPDQPAA
ncbi:hypothetical protein ACIQ6R_16220 [Streptomyces sp. NPDC096048]|uniref:hypothetical protein n=1 Tax=Streptomyces sp. NPDC096048 TaxID=3366072 RepID=UPI00381C6739